VNPKPLRSLSASKLTTFLDCPRKFWFNYVLRMPVPETQALALGSKVHGHIEEFLLTGQWRDDSTEANIGRAGQEILEPYRVRVQEGSAIVEHGFKVPEGDLWSGTYSGRIDLLLRDPNPGIVDHKTTGRLISPWSLDAEGMANDLQLLSYAAFTLDANAQTDYTLGHIYYQTKGKPKARSLIVQVPGKKILGVKDRLKRLSATIEPIAALVDPEAQVKVPARRSGCAKFGGCPFADTCVDSPLSEERRNKAILASRPKRPQTTGARMSIFKKSKTAETPAAIVPPDAAPSPSAIDRLLSQFRDDSANSYVGQASWSAFAKAAKAIGEDPIALAKLGETDGKWRKDGLSIDFTVGWAAEPKKGRAPKTLAPESADTDPGDAGSAILSFLASKPDGAGRAEILAGTGLGEGDWTAAIDGLTSAGLVVKTGQKRGTKYALSEAAPAKPTVSTSPKPAAGVKPAPYSQPTPAQWSESLELAGILAHWATETEHTPDEIQVTDLRAALGLTSASDVSAFGEAVAYGEHGAESQGSATLWSRVGESLLPNWDRLAEIDTVPADIPEWWTAPKVAPKAEKAEKPAPKAEKPAPKAEKPAPKPSIFDRAPQPAPDEPGLDTPILLVGCLTIDIPAVDIDTWAAEVIERAESQHGPLALLEFGKPGPTYANEVRKALASGELELPPALFVPRNHYAAGAIATALVGMVVIVRACG
jgi:hypothetical protein